MSREGISSGALRALTDAEVKDLPDLPSVSVRETNPGATTPHRPCTWPDEGVVVACGDVEDGHGIGMSTDVAEFLSGYQEESQYAHDLSLNSPTVKGDLPSSSRRSFRSTLGDVLGGGINSRLGKRRRRGDSDGSLH